MPIQHIVLALLVIFIWGFNFVFIKFALDEISPLLLCALRFILSSFPALLFIKPPAVPFRWVAWYGLLTFALQFTLLFWGMHVGMTPGMASLLLQVQVFCSMLFAAIFIREIPNIWQISGALIAFTGIGFVASHLDGTMTLTGFLLILSAAAAWGLGNLITKKIGKVNMIALVVWGSAVASIPLCILLFFLEGPQHSINNLQSLSSLGWTSILYIVYASTWIGYGVWNWLINRYSVSTIVPFTLLVPIIAILSSIIIFDEPFQDWKLISGLLVITGLCVNLLGPRFRFFLKNKADIAS